MANEYDELMALEPKADENEYDSLMAGQHDNEAANLKLSFREANKTTPESAAEVANLVDRTGLPEDVVNRNKEQIKAEDAVERNDYDAMIKSYPVMAKHYQDHGFAKVARDDADNLPIWEQLTQGLSDTPEKFQGGRNVNRVGELGYEALTSKIDEEGMKELKHLESIGQQKEQNKGFLYDVLTNTAELTGQFVEPAAKAIHQGSMFGVTAGSAAIIAGQAGPQVALPEEVITVPAATLAGFAVGSTMYMTDHAYRVEAGHAYVEFSQIRDDQGKALDPAAVKAASHIVGSINAGLEIGGLTIIAKAAGISKLSSLALRNQTKQLFKKASFRKAFTEFAKRYATAWGGEVSTEILQEGTNIVIGEMLKAADEGQHRLLTAAEAGQRLGDIAYKVGTGMIIPAAGASATNFVIDAKKARQAKQQQRVMEAIGSSAENTKLRELSPKKYRNFVAEATKDGPVENIYIKSEQFDEYFQSKGIDPQKAADELGIGEQYQEAIETGGDLEIKTADYAQVIAATEHHQELMRHARFNPQDFSIAESEQFEQDYEVQLKEHAEDVIRRQEEIAVSEEPLDRIFNELKHGLSQAGMRPDAAVKQAAMHRAFFKVMGDRSGKSPEELYNRWKLKVRRQFPEALAEVDTTDLMIDAARQRKIVSPRKVYGPSLGEFLAERGGILDEGGEVLARDLQRERVGRRRIVSKTGKTIDDAVQAAREAGYDIPEDATSHDALLDALSREFAGEPLYAPGNIDQQLADRETALNELSDYLESIGLDIDEATNQEVKEALTRGSIEEKVDTRKYRKIFDQDVSRETIGAIPLSEIVVEIDAVEEETGRAMKINERADVALQDIDNQLNVLQELVECLG